MTAAPPAPTPARGSPPAKAPRQAGLILLVEDDPKLRRLYSDVLGATGYTVLAAQSGKEGINLLVSNVPKVVILDIMLPDMNGIEICRRARQVLGDRVPIIFMSSLDQIDVLESCLEAGGDDFIVKGSNLQAMTQRIHHWAKTGVQPSARENRGRALSAIQAATQQNASAAKEQTKLSSENDKAVAEMSHLVAMARKAAAQEFGQKPEEKLFLFGYVTGIVRFFATCQTHLKTRQTDYLRAVLGESGMLNEAEIARILPQLDQLMAEATFAAAVNRGSADAVVNQAKGAGFTPTSLASFKCSAEQSAHARRLFEGAAG